MRIDPGEPICDGICYSDLWSLSKRGCYNELAARGVVFLTEFDPDGLMLCGDVIAPSLKSARRGQKYICRGCSAISPSRDHIPQHLYRPCRAQTARSIRDRFPRLSPPDRSDVYTDLSSNEDLNSCLPAAHRNQPRTTNKPQALIQSSSPPTTPRPPQPPQPLPLNRAIHPEPMSPSAKRSMDESPRSGRR